MYYFLSNASYVNLLPCLVHQDFKHDGIAKEFSTVQGQLSQAAIPIMSLRKPVFPNSGPVTNNSFPSCGPSGNNCEQLIKHYSLYLGVGTLNEITSVC